MQQVFASELRDSALALPTRGLCAIYEREGRVEFRAIVDLDVARATKDGFLVRLLRRRPQLQGRGSCHHRSHLRAPPGGRHFGF